MLENESVVAKRVEALVTVDAVAAAGRLVEQREHKPVVGDGFLDGKQRHQSGLRAEPTCAYRYVTAISRQQ